MYGISCVCVPTGSDENETVEHNVYGRGDNFTSIGVCRSPVLEKWGPGLEPVSQNGSSSVLHCKVCAGEECNSVFVQGLSNDQG